MGENGPAIRARRRERRPARQLHRKWRLFVEHIPEGANYYKPWNMRIRTGPWTWASIDSPQPYLFSALCGTDAQIPTGRRRPRRAQPPDHLRERIKADDGPTADLVFERDDNKGDEFPITALTQRPMAMYHSWGSQNAWLRQLHGHNPLYMPDQADARTRATGRRLGEGHLAPRRNHRAGHGNGGAERKHDLDVERHRQTQRRMGAGQRTHPKAPKGSCSTT